MLQANFGATDLINRRNPETDTYPMPLNWQDMLSRTSALMA
jgi:hypothetical protein